MQVKVINTLTTSPVSNAQVTAGSSIAKTNQEGLATLVLPSAANTLAASVTLSGYNTTKVNINAAGSQTQDTFDITPAGRVYFLSNASGSIDVVKTNLDATDRETVLAGTGSEDPGTTSLLASRDWKYLALLSRRGGSSATLYLIDTTNGDKLTTVDPSDPNATFTLVGWDGDQLIYTVNRSSGVSNWQSGQQALESFDPTTDNNLLLDQTQASGTSQTDWVGQDISQAYIVGSRVIYAKGWNASSSDVAQLNAKQAELDAIGADGSNHQTLQTFSVGSGSVATSSNVSIKPYGLSGLYIAWPNGGATTQYYTYANGSVTANSSMSDAQFGSLTPSTYLLSPSGNQTLWADPLPGGSALFTGDQNGLNQKQVTAINDYGAYGWYTDNYLLVSKGGDELYVMPAASGKQFKISTYFEPTLSYQDGGGYGGL